MIKKTNFGETVGPWEWDEDSDGSVLVGGHDGELIIGVMDWDGDNSVVSADARLIAAAPEMYELLKSLVRDGDPMTTDTRIADLLAKIEGTTP